MLWIRIRKILTNIEVKPEWTDIEGLLAAIRKDKKQTSESINAVLIQDNLELAVFKDIKEKEIQKAVEKILQ